LRAPSSLHALRQAVGLTPSAVHPLVVQDVPLASTTVEALAVVIVYKVTLLVVEVSAPAALVGSAVAPSSTIAASLLSVGVVTTNAPVAPPPSSSAPMVPPSTALASLSTSSHPHVSLDHIYTFNDANSLWAMGYKPE